MGLRFLHKLKSNTSYIQKLNTLDNSENQKYEGSVLKKTGIKIHGRT